MKFYSLFFLVLVLKECYSNEVEQEPNDGISVSTRGMLDSLNPLGSFGKNSKESSDVDRLERLNPLADLDGNGVPDGLDKLAGLKLPKGFGKSNSDMTL